MTHDDDRDRSHRSRVTDLAALVCGLATLITAVTGLVAAAHGG
ncbi:hypothetical protein [Actinomadura formosensis]|nr:hypothetical protein [Actinomadura formosensis]